MCLRSGRIEGIFNIRRIVTEGEKKNIFEPKNSLGCSESHPKLPHGSCNARAHTTHTHTRTHMHTHTHGPGATAPEVVFEDGKTVRNKEC